MRHAKALRGHAVQPAATHPANSARPRRIKSPYPAEREVRATFVLGAADPGRKANSAASTYLVLQRPSPTINIERNSTRLEIGRAERRERGSQYGEIQVGAGTIKK